MSADTYGIFIAAPPCLRNRSWARCARRTETLDLVIYWRSIAKRKWTILMLALGRFQRATWLVVEPANADLSLDRYAADRAEPHAKVAPTEEVYASVGDSREHFQTQAEILKARALAVKIVDKLQPRESPISTRGSKSCTWHDKLKKQLGFDAAAGLDRAAVRNAAAVDVADGVA